MKQDKKNSTVRMPQRHLVVMVKAPIAGAVKTRLARSIGHARAVAFYRHATAAVIRRVGAGKRWRVWLGVAPDHALFAPVWPSAPDRFAQGRGDLGQRMQRVMDGLPPGPVVIVGSDIPGITAGHIDQAFMALGENDAVFGPAPDGGYWLVGLKRFPTVLRAFDDVRWSSEATLEDTCANLNGCKIALLEQLDDVDTFKDLQSYGGTWGRIVPSISGMGR